MSESTAISFVLRGKVNGIDLTPRTVGLSQFNEFNRQVEDFIKGSQGLGLEDTQVEVTEGSYKLLVTLPLLVMSDLKPDIQVLERQDSLGEIDPKRQEIVAKWQAQAKKRPEWAYQIAPENNDLPTIKISQASDFRVGAIVPWIKVEKYLLGEVVNMGGATKGNIHLKLEDTGKTLIVNAAQGYLRDQTENLVYHKVSVHVEGEQHYKTGELRNMRLISFTDYAPAFDEAALDAFAAKGQEAWADVSDAGDWVRRLRGGD